MEVSFRPSDIMEYIFRNTGSALAVSVCVCLIAAPRTSVPCMSTVFVSRCPSDNMEVSVWCERSGVSTLHGQHLQTTELH